MELIGKKLEGLSLKIENMEIYFLTLKCVIL